ncbi:MAG: OmpA/MotB domain protein [Rhizorhabdus sp.]|nr:OmpA/MotB domain protein [Rhizorhabdus sp.]
MVHRFLSFAAAALLAGCAAGPSLTLLPDEQGGHGAVAVLETNGKPRETVVDLANSRTTLSGANPRPRTFDPARLTPQQRGLLTNMPPPPVRFMLYFAEGTTDLTADSVPMLGLLRTEIATRPGPEVQVTGFTDTTGTTEYNDALSQKRAEEILGALARKGIDPHLMTAVGRGERVLREQTGDGVANAANRRVEVIVR